MGERFAPELEGAGWRYERHVLMAHRRPAERAADTSLVTEVTADVIRPARESQIRSYPWGTAEVAEQLLAAKEHIPVEARFFAVLLNGAVASYSDLYLDGDIGQVEDVATLPEHRGRGYASAVVLRAVEEARAAGAGPRLPRRRCRGLAEGALPPSRLRRDRREREARQDRSLRAAVRD